MIRLCDTKLKFRMSSFDRPQPRLEPFIVSTIPHYTSVVQQPHHTCHAPPSGAVEVSAGGAKKSKNMVFRWINRTTWKTMLEWSPPVPIDNTIHNSFLW